MEARLILDEPASGSWNMAVDEALLELADRHGATCLRFYRWSEPTLSLGYFQPVADRASHAASGGCPYVRRTTGGGAILHDAELTYSFTSPSREQRSGGALEFYDHFHQALVEELATLGVRAKMWGLTQRRSPEPFLCFQRRSKGDVVVGEVKVCGSAQRRHRGVILQHGSVLLQRSTAAPELAGIAELSGQLVDQADLIPGWTDRLASSLGFRWVEGSLSVPEEQLAQELVAAKFGSSDWNERR